MKITSEIALKIVAVNKVLRREFGGDVLAEVVVSDSANLELEISAGGGTDYSYCEVPFDIVEGGLNEFTNFVKGKATDLLVAMGGD